MSPSTSQETLPLISESVGKKKAKRKKKKKRKKRKDNRNQLDDGSGSTSQQQPPPSKRQKVEHGDSKVNDTSQPSPVGMVASKDDEISQSVDFPFATEPDDHCESPKTAYADIACLLHKLQELLPQNFNASAQNATNSIKSASHSLSIYDPYYCNGAVIQNLLDLGFPNVYNQKEDCYAVWSSTKSSTKAYPDYQVLLTNPPYSGDHVERLIRHVTSPTSPHRQRPFFLLLPTWVHKKDFYQASVQGKPNKNMVRPFYIVPKKRYVYVPPKDFRAAKKSDVHKKSSPFVSMWYIWGGTDQLNERLIQHFYKTQRDNPTCDLARSKSALRDLRRK